MKQDLHGYRRLEAGDLSLLYAKGEIRRICVGNIQVINAIYGAVRDRNWGTVPCQIREESVREDRHGFHIDIRLSFEEAVIDFDAMIRIRGLSDRITFHFDGTARSTFLRNRIGICVLHPTGDCRGYPLEVVHPDGSISSGKFPEMISPDQPFLNISGIRWKAAGPMEAELAFSGELFEMEDQRNWTDASFKTYGTPLEIPFPVQVQAGEKVIQSVSLNIKSLHINPAKVWDSRISISFPSASTYPIPEIGSGSHTDPEPLQMEESQLLRNIGLRHLRTDLYPGQPDFEKQYDRAEAEQKLLGWPLEIALHFDRHYRKELELFLDIHMQKPVPIKQLLLFDREHLSNNKLLRDILPGLRSRFPGIPIGGGTNAYFAELNRNRPETDLLDFITYSICPQVHASDNLSLVENLEAQYDTVISAQSFFQKPVSIGALTLKQRFNIVATGEGPDEEAYPLSDDRQDTVFAAAWTLCSIKQLALAGARSLSYYETIGPRGLMARSGTEKQFYPLFHLFKEVLNGKYTQLVPLYSSNPLYVDGLMLHGLRDRVLLLANHSDRIQEAHFSNLEIRIRDLFQLSYRGWKELVIKEQGSISMAPTSVYKIKIEP